MRKNVFPEDIYDQRIWSARLSSNGRTIKYLVGPTQELGEWTEGPRHAREAREWPQMLSDFDRSGGAQCLHDFYAEIYDDVDNNLVIYDGMRGSELWRTRCVLERDLGLEEVSDTETGLQYTGVVVMYSV